MTATGPDVWTALVPLLSAVLGGLIGSLSGLGAQLLTHFLGQKKESAQRKRDRFSRLVDLILDHDHWLDKRRLSRVYGEGDEIATPPPIALAGVLVAVHFPEIKDDFDFLHLESSNYLTWMAEAAERRTAQAANLNDGFIEAYKAYLDRYVIFQRRLSDYAQTNVPD